MRRQLLFPTSPPSILSSTRNSPQQLPDNSPIRRGPQELKNIIKLYCSDSAQTFILRLGRSLGELSIASSCMHVRPGWWWCTHHLTAPSDTYNHRPTWRCRSIYPDRLPRSLPGHHHSQFHPIPSHPSTNQTDNETLLQPEQNHHLSWWWWWRRRREWSGVELTWACRGPKSLNLDQLGATTLRRTRFPRPELHGVI